MADVVQTKKKIALLHRYPPDQIRQTNAAFEYLKNRGIDVLTFKTFPRTSLIRKWLKSIAWIFYAPLLVFGKGYEVIYCDDSFPFYPILIRLASPRSKIILRLGDLHLMYYASGILYRILHIIERIGWELADEILVISDAMAEEIKIPAIVIPDPVDPKDFPRNGSASYGTIMFHGVLSENKGVELLIEAARRLGHLRFVIIGDGPARKRLMKDAPLNVFFKGWVPFKEIHRYIATCAIGVALRSQNPGNQFVVTSPFLQYGVMGKPCLVTRRKVFNDYQWQFSDLDELIEKIEYLIRRPYVQVEEGERLRNRILWHHDANRVADMIWARLSGS